MLLPINLLLFWRGLKRQMGVTVPAILMTVLQRVRILCRVM